MSNILNLYRSISSSVIYLCLNMSSNILNLCLSQITLYVPDIPQSRFPISPHPCFLYVSYVPVFSNSTISGSYIPTLIPVSYMSPISLFSLTPPSLFPMSPISQCTDEISISDVNRQKTSLAIIYICLKMYCYKCTC